MFKNGQNPFMFLNNKQTPCIKGKYKASVHLSGTSPRWSCIRSRGRSSREGNRGRSWTASGPQLPGAVHRKPRNGWLRAAAFYHWQVKDSGRCLWTASGTCHRGLWDRSRSRSHRRRSDWCQTLTNKSPRFLNWTSLQRKCKGKRNQDIFHILVR